MIEAKMNKNGLLWLQRLQERTGHNIYCGLSSLEDTQKTERRSRTLLGTFLSHLSQGGVQASSGDWELVTVTMSFKSMGI